MEYLNYTEWKNHNMAILSLRSSIETIKIGF
jgi:hypothetical protein